MLNKTLSSSQGTWTTTGSMVKMRTEHTASVLANGRVLIVGGYDNLIYHNTSELYNVSSGM